MKTQKISDTELARRMGNSCTRLERLLDPDNDRVQLKMAQHAVIAVREKLSIVLVDETQAQGDRNG